MVFNNCCSKEINQTKYENNTMQNLRLVQSTWQSLNRQAEIGLSRNYIFFLTTKTYHLTYLWEYPWWLVLMQGGDSFPSIFDQQCCSCGIKRGVRRNRAEKTRIQFSVSQNWGCWCIRHLNIIKQSYWMTWLRKGDQRAGSQIAALPPWYSRR